MPTRNPTGKLDAGQGYEEGEDGLDPPKTKSTRRRETRLVPYGETERPLPPNDAASVEAVWVMEKPGMVEPVLT